MIEMMILKVPTWYDILALLLFLSNALKPEHHQPTPPLSSQPPVNRRSPLADLTNAPLTPVQPARLPPSLHHLYLPESDLDGDFLEALLPPVLQSGALLLGLPLRLLLEFLLHRPPLASCRLI